MAYRGLRRAAFRGSKEATISATTGRRWPNKGFPAPIVMALGGWKSERMMRRYAAVTDQTLRLAAEAVSGVEVHVTKLLSR